MTHCIFRTGDSFGTTTQKTLVDPTTNHAENLTLSNRLLDDFKIHYIPRREIDKVAVSFKTDGPVYKHPTSPGYEGMLPRQHGLFGQSYTIQTVEALSDYELWRTRDRLAANQLSQVNSTGNKPNWDPCNLNDTEIVKSQFQLPLLTVRPECATLLRNLPIDEPPMAPPDHYPSPYFMENPDFNNAKQGYSNKVPFGYASFGKTSQAITGGQLFDFTSNYRKRLSTEWAPVSISRPDPPLLIQPSEIYHRHIGHLPNYAGHIPGSIFRFGKTYGNDSRDAKRWLRGDFST